LPFLPSFYPVATSTGNVVVIFPFSVEGRPLEGSVERRPSFWRGRDLIILLFSRRSLLRLSPEGRRPISLKRHKSSPFSLRISSFPPSLSPSMKGLLPAGRELLFSESRAFFSNSLWRTFLERLFFLAACQQVAFPLGRAHPSLPQKFFSPFLCAQNLLMKRAWIPPSQAWRFLSPFILGVALSPFFLPLLT